MKKERETSKETGHSFEDYFKRAANPMLVLLLLTERTMYVYEMVQELLRRSDGDYELSLLYPVLYRLTAQGYVREGEKKISEDNRVRQYYEITPEGKEYCAEIMVCYDHMADTVARIRSNSTCG